MCRHITWVAQHSADVPPTLSANASTLADQVQTAQHIGMLLHDMLVGMLLPDMFVGKLLHDMFVGELLHDKFDGMLLHGMLGSKQERLH